MTPRVIGLDLSLTATGIALPDGQPATITSGAKLRGTARLSALRQAVMSTMRPRPDLVVIEGPAYSRALQQGHHEAAGLWWQIAVALDEQHIPAAVIGPSALKKYATGRGNATKPDMRMALFQRAGIDLRDDNQCDAWWLRAAGLDHLGHPPVSIPADQRKALDKSTWPEGPTP